MAQLIALFEHGKTFGSLIRVPENMAEKLLAIAERVQDVLAYGGMFEQAAARSVEPIIEQAHHLAQKYDCVVANPPYMGNKGLNSFLRDFARTHYPNSKSDLYAVFMERLLSLIAPHCYLGLMTPFTWFFIKCYGTPWNRNSSFKKCPDIPNWKHLNTALLTMNSVCPHLLCNQPIR